MRRLIHLTLSPPSRLARLMLGEKRLAFDPVGPRTRRRICPCSSISTARAARLVGGDRSSRRRLSGSPDGAGRRRDQRRDALRWLDWAMGQMSERATRKILYEKAAQRFTGAPSRGAPDMNVMRQGREALRAALPIIGKAAEQNGNLVDARLHARRSRRGRPSLGARLFRRSAVERISASRRMVYAHEIAAVFPLAAWRTACPASRRSCIMPNSISDPTRGDPRRAPSPKVSTSCDSRAPNAPAKRPNVCTHFWTKAVTARWTGWRATPIAAPIRSAVAGRQKHHRARRQLRAGSAIRSTALTRANAARSRSMRKATTITTC